MSMNLELQDDVYWAEKYTRSDVRITVGPKDGYGLVRVVECSLGTEGTVEPVKLVEVWDEDGKDVPFQLEVPKEVADWITSSKEVEESVARLLRRLSDED